jgi:alkylation response protein AidB-like acyl-CoA dehydrogenase
MTTIDAGTGLLTDEMLARFDERAPQYDKENRFFTEDFEELRASGYLNAPLHEDFGGPGLLMNEVNRLQRRLAYVAAPTALAVNMHLYWVGLASDLHRMGDPTGDWMLAQAADGAIFAAGHGEVGNDLPLLLAVAQAERVDGGWEITGHKIFGSLSPVWTYLGFHAQDNTSDPDNPQIVHGFLHRDASRYHIEETWDVLGMRATASHDTIFDKAFVPDEAVPVVCPTGFAGASMFHVGIFMWALSGFAAVYYSMAKRAFDDLVARLPQRKSMALTRSMAYHPEIQHMVADMRIALEAAEAHLDKVVDQWSAGVEYEDWPVRVVAMKHHVVSRAWEVVDTALDASGGSGIFKRERLEQLVRDCRLGRIHPANPMLTHELIGKMTLGINPDEAPRWG